jgi:hypothetical protein
VLFGSPGVGFVYRYGRVVIGPNTPLAIQSKIALIWEWFSESETEDGVVLGTVQ